MKKELLCSAEMYVMSTGDPQNATPKKRTATRARPGDSLIKEGKKRPQVLKKVKTSLKVSSLWQSHCSEDREELRVEMLNMDGG